MVAVDGYWLRNIHNMSAGQLLKCGLFLFTGVRSQRVHLQGAVYIKAPFCASLNLELKVCCRAVGLAVLWPLHPNLHGNKQSREQHHTPCGYKNARYATDAKHESP